MDITSIIKVASAISTVASIIFFDVSSIKKSYIYKEISKRYNNYNHPGYTEKDILEHLDTVYPPIEEEYDTITKSQVLTEPNGPDDPNGSIYFDSKSFE